MQDLLKFVLLLVFEIPAVFLSILIFVYFITHPLARSKPKNHAWLVLLIVNFLQLVVKLPMSMSFYYLGEIWPATNTYCLCWQWCQHATTAGCLMLTARASVERHLFIFRPTFMLGAPWKKWIYHFLPVILSISCPSLLYLILIVISPICTNVWDFNYVICGIPCYQSRDNGIFGIIDTVTLIFMPLSSLVIANIALMARVIYGKTAGRRVVDWRRHRKMTIQLWFISLLYLAGWLPLAITLLIRMITFSSFLDDQHATLTYLVDFISLLLPFVCLAVFPEITNSCREFLRRRRRNRVGVVLAAVQTPFPTRL